MTLENSDAAQALVQEIVRRIVRDTSKMAVSFTPELDVRPDLLGNFIGGDSYWSPQGVPVTSADGSPLYPLMQIRCTEPSLPGYPTRGLLQFFIGTDIMYGCDLSADYDSEADNDNRCVRYIPEVPSVLSGAEIVRLPHIGADSDPDLHTPFRSNFHGCALRPALIEDPVSHECDEFEPAYESIIAEFDPAVIEATEDAVGDLDQAVMDQLNAVSPGSWFQMGGHPVFTQSDVREDYDDELVLLKVDSYDDVLMWGDSGCANFLIRREDLEQLDFSHVLYTWDCL
ncbi:YwqG family protein [Bifidobacterium felsineum]|uniref:DUF1963 domain-containing protein n=1 Tax=Bifidobacterium felsineum TaxID=2045440 RepID=A0A2M9HLE1_9BIFI|nr:DUF1963 domain-containing protein [Bifidobacterium felsineum]MBT1163158.1 DUF1963 domain-containing protein [Bifidobacterium felsineum]PJM77638.1 hypothetical protein CSQ86_00685 [Bifidobacterium felsineum]